MNIKTNTVPWRILDGKTDSGLSFNFKRNFQFYYFLFDQFLYTLTNLIKLNPFGKQCGLGYNVV